MKDEWSYGLNVWRAIKTEFQKFNTAKGGHFPDDVEQYKIISKMMAQRLDSINQYQIAKRQDLVENEQFEFDALAIIRDQYYPTPPTSEELEEALFDFAKEGGLMQAGDPEIPKKKMGDAIKFLKFNFPLADGREISELVKKYTV